jgi:hypothetical protein
MFGLAAIPHRGPAGFTNDEPPRRSRRAWPALLLEVPGAQKQEPAHHGCLGDTAYLRHRRGRCGLVIARLPR